MTSLSDAPALLPDGTPHRHVVGVISEFTARMRIAETVAAGLAAVVAERGKAATVDGVLRLFFAGLDGVVVNARDHRASKLLQAWLRDERALDDRQVERALAFLSQQLIAKTQGELAEMLALGQVQRRVAQWRAEGRLPAEARLLPGLMLRLRQNRNAGWYKGADGLIAVPMAERLLVCGVIEIKAYCPKPEVVAGQIRNHIRRLRRGLWLDGAEWPPEALGFLCHTAAGWVETAIDAPPPDLPLLLVATRRRPADGVDLSLPAAETLYLEESYALLRESGMVLAEWLIAKYGEIIFTDPADRPPGMDAEDAGINGLRSALHYARWRRLSRRGKALAERMYAVFCLPLDEAEES